MHVGVDLTGAYCLGEISDTRDVHPGRGHTVRVWGDGSNIRIRQGEFG